MIETEQSPVYYQIGRDGGMPVIPPVDADCVAVEAGPLRFVVEARQLNESAITAALASTGGEATDDVAAFDDFGGSVHVYGAADNLEYLRFDCFEKDPHYHYFNQALQKNRVCRLDDAADGDPIEWTLTRLRDRLPEMLAFAGVPALSAATRSAMPTVLASVGQVAELLREASRRARAERVAG